MISGQEALQRLKDGNARFVAGESASHLTTDQFQRHKLVAGQEPFALILGCSDSRVPAELLFDQGFGDLFVVRVAGNVAAPTQLGSIEYAITQLGTRLIVVLGHSGCGAIQTTLQEMASPTPDLSPNLAALVNLIKPALANVGDADPIHANIEASLRSLVRDSEIIAGMVAEQGLLIVGGQYCLETSEVTFFQL